MLDVVEDRLIGRTPAVTAAPVAAVRSLTQRALAARPPADRLHHVQLAMPAGSEDAAVAFYVGVLGYLRVDKPAALAARGGCWFRGPRIELHLGVESPFAPARKAHPGIITHELDDVADRLRAAGHDVTWDSLMPGHRRFYTHDPFGNRLEFLEPEAGG